MQNRTEKRCPDCDTTKAVSAFARNRARYDGLSSICRVCAGNRQRVKRNADIDTAREYNKLATRKYRLSHPEDVQRGRVNAREWRRKNPERAAENYNRFIADNPGYTVIKDAKRRAQKLGAGLESITAAQWRALQEYFNFRCAYCLAPVDGLTQDHIIALSRGGEHVLGNIVPACKSCNSRKNNSTLIGFLARAVKEEVLK